MLGSNKIVAMVGTLDPVRAKSFYQDSLGLKFVSEDSFAVVFETGGTMLRVSIVPELKPAKFTVLGWDVADITATVQGLEKTGVKFERFGGMPQDDLGIWTAPGGAKVAWFKDPDGNILSLTEF